MVCEIGEHEMAELAIQATLTGHLVLSTVHCNDEMGAITRLLDLGISEFFDKKLSMWNNFTKTCGLTLYDAMRTIGS
jgi:Tfp pilus assembly pilus retraction ATPase PilT